MDEKISIIDNGKLSSRCNTYTVGVHNMLEKNTFNTEEIENISQKVKEEFIVLLKKYKREK
jgi:hypothetical protein